MYGDSRLSDLAGRDGDKRINKNSESDTANQELEQPPTVPRPLTQGAAVVAATQRAVEAVVSCRLHLVLGG